MNKKRPSLPVLLLISILMTQSILLRSQEMNEMWGGGTEAKQLSKRGRYYNQDWTYPGGAGGPRVDHEGNKKTFDNYFVEKCLPQVEEITKNYGEIELIHKDWMEKFGEWKQAYNVKDWTRNSAATWDVVVKEAGMYHIDLTYSGQGRLVWGITTDEGYAIQNQQNSSHIYAKHPIGWIKFDKPGKHTITTKLIEGSFEHASLTDLSITPVRF